MATLEEISELADRIQPVIMSKLGPIDAATAIDAATVAILDIIWIHKQRIGYYKNGELRQKVVDERYRILSDYVAGWR